MAEERDRAAAFMRPWTRQLDTALIETTKLQALCSMEYDCGDVLKWIVQGQ